jgi:transcriptional regulator GlxA family with amidase domain
MNTGIDLLARDRAFCEVLRRPSLQHPALTVDDVARACLISRRTLYRLFEGTHGGIGRLLREIRVEHAQALLRTDTSRPLDAIALACGFAGERQFYRAFRQATGLTPGEFRAAGTAGQ